MKFKQRESTQFIHVDMKNLKGAGVEKLFKEARRNGELDTGYHIILSNTGLCETDREKGAVAQYNFPDANCSLYILADTGKIDKLNDAQNAALRQVLQDYPAAKLELRLVE